MIDETTLSFAILGSGLQGTAAAYDLIRTANPREVRVIDRDLDAALAASDRLFDLTRFRAAAVRAEIGRAHV